MERYTHQIANTVFIFDEMHAPGSAKKFAVYASSDLLYTILLGASISRENEKDALIDILHSHLNLVS
jgi:hypothetical protein